MKTLGGGYCSVKAYVSREAAKGAQKKGIAGAESCFFILRVLRGFA